MQFGEHLVGQFGEVHVQYRWLEADAVGCCEQSGEQFHQPFGAAHVTGTARPLFIGVQFGKTVLRGLPTGIEDDVQLHQGPWRTRSCCCLGCLREGIGGVRGDQGNVSLDGGDQLSGREHHHLPLDWARDDGRSLDGEALTVKVGVVQLVPVQVPAGGNVTDHRVVFPGVPEPAAGLDHIRGFADCLAIWQLCAPHGAGFLVQVVRGDQPTRPPQGGVVQTGQLRSYMERLSEERSGLRDKTDGAGDRCCKGRTLDRINPARNPGASRIHHAAVLERGQMETGDVRCLDSFTDPLAPQ